MTPTAPRIDIVICTRDRLALLRETVAAVLLAVGPREDVRLLILDNGSSDGTSDYLFQLGTEEHRTVTASVPSRGLYNARTVAIEMSDADVLVFCDDDIHPRPGFLDHLETVFRDPSIGVLGAAIEGPRLVPLPDWFTPRFQCYIPILPVPGDRQECRYPCYPPGAFLAVRRTPFLDFYLADERRAVDLGYGGVSGLGGEDTDLCEIFARAGYRVVRDAGLTVTHHFDPARLTEDWIVDRFFREGRLRVLLARLRTGSAQERSTLLMLVAWPALKLLVGIGPLLGRSNAVFLRAYLRKADGAWWELLRGHRHGRLPYPEQV
ncbi:MAG: glycosyltransferase family 2 protein [Alphaproteobacteria bacterium]